MGCRRRASRSMTGFQTDARPLAPGKNTTGGVAVFVSSRGGVTVVGSRASVHRPARPGGGIMVAPAIPFGQSSGVVARRMQELLERQRSAYLASGPPPLDLRLERLDRLATAVAEHETQI